MSVFFNHDEAMTMLKEQGFEEVWVENWKKFRGITKIWTGQWAVEMLSIKKIWKRPNTAIMISMDRLRAPLYFIKNDMIILKKDSYITNEDWVLILNAIVDPSLAPTLMGIKWATKLTEALLKI